MIQKYTLLQKQLGLVAFVLLAELILIASLVNLLDQEESQTLRAERAYAVTAQANLLLQEFNESITSLLVFGLTGSQEFGRRMETLTVDVPQKTSALKSASAEFPEDRENMQQIVQSARLWEKLFIQARAILAHRSQPGMTVAVVHFLNYDVKPHMLELSQSVARFAEHHKQVETRQREMMDRSKSLLRMILFAGAAMQVVLAVVSFIFLNRYITNRLNILKQNSFRLASGVPLLPRIRGADEIAQVDAVFHKMAAALTDSAEKEKAIVDGMPVGFIILNNRGEITLANPRALSMLAASAQQVLGKPLPDFVSACEGDKLSFENIKESALGRISEFRLLRSDGGSFPCELSINAIKDENQELLICNVLDVSERYEVERMKKEFVSIVSHDLKTPLTSIQHSLFLLARGTLGSLNEKGMKIVTGTQQEAERLVRLVTNLLDIARMEAGRIDLDCATVDLGSIVTRAVNSTEVLAEEKKITLETGDASFEIFADADRLVQVLVNFLANAIKYSAAGSTVKIECLARESAASADGKAMVVRVTDQGPGIAKSDQARIFGQFEQVSPQDRKEKGGTGLGLAICRLIVEAHGGTIGVDSEVGEGASFWVEIPLRSASASAPIVEPH